MLYFHHKVSFKGTNCHSYTHSNPAKQLLKLEHIVVIVYYLPSNWNFDGEKWLWASVDPNPLFS